MKEILTLYHGSQNIIKKPIFGYGKPYNDYGLGFYCAEDESMACEWAVQKDRNGYSNIYLMKVNGLRVLNLTDDKYTILHWLTILLENRHFDIQSDFGEEARQYLFDNFSLDYKTYDVIIGYRADDSYFAFAQDFLNGLCSIRKLSKAMYLGQLGEQIVLKSQKAFDRIEYQSSNIADAKIWYPKKELRDTTARTEYLNNRKEKRRMDDIYMLNILNEEMKPDDVRLQ